MLDTTMQRLDNFARRIQEPRQLQVVLTLALSLVLAIVYAFGDPTVAVSLLGITPLVWLALCRPAWFLGFTLAQLSLLPDHGHVFGMFVPSVLQFAIPALILGVLFDRWRQRSHGWVGLYAGDLFVAGFLFLGYLGIGLISGPDPWKYYTNQVVFPGLIYFAVRWMDLDRQKVLGILRAMLIAAFIMSPVLVLTPVIGSDPIYHGARGYQGMGAAARGPIGAVSDTAAYASMWVPMFLYAASVVFVFRPHVRALAMVGALTSGLGAIATNERIALAAVPAALVVSLIPRAQRRNSALLLCLGVVAGLVWLNSGVGSRLQSKLQEEDKTFRRRVYIRKAIDYMKSPEWNRWLGTGFARLEDNSNDMLLPTVYVWHPRLQAWRPVREIGKRPVHCAPLNILGEYGLLGTTALLGVIASALLAIPRMYRTARSSNGRVDTSLLWAIAAAAVAVFVNGLYHNTDKVHQVAAVLWFYAGIIIGHPKAFVIPNGTTATNGTNGMLAEGKANASKPRALH